MSSGMLEKWFVQKITKVALVRTPYGDFTADPNGFNQTLYCRFRLYAEGARTSVPYEEQHIPLAEAWFSAETDIKETDIFLYDNQYWEIVRIRNARRGRHADISFLKVDLTMHTMVS